MFANSRIHDLILLRRHFLANRRLGRSPQSRMLGTLNAVPFAMFFANGHGYLRQVTSVAHGGELNRHIATSASPWRVPSDRQQQTLEVG